MNKNYIKNEKGQALLFVVVALTVAMAIGMSVSTRTISSVRRSTSTDTSSRVYSAAEGGIEWFLNQPTNVLEKLSDGNNSGGTDCPTGTTDFDGDTFSCVITYSSATGDNVTSRAIVNIAPFTFNNPTGSTNHYWFYVNSGEVKEIKLNNPSATLQVCWSSQDASITPDIYYLIYNDDGARRKGILRNVSGTNAGNMATIPGSLITSAIVSPHSGLDFTNCASISVPAGNRGIRFKAMYAPAKVGVFVTAGSLPTQGYTIHSTGELFEHEAIKTVKMLRVFRSRQYLPAVFDYALYSDTTLGLTP